MGTKKIETGCVCWEFCSRSDTCYLSGAAARACQNSPESHREALRNAMGGMLTISGVIGRANSETR